MVISRVLWTISSLMVNGFPPAERANWQRCAGGSTGREQNDQAAVLMHRYPLSLYCP